MMSGSGCSSSDSLSIPSSFVLNHARPSPNAFGVLSEDVLFSRGSLHPGWVLLSSVLKKNPRAVVGGVATLEASEARKLNGFGSGHSTFIERATDDFLDDEPCGSGFKVRSRGTDGAEHAFGRSQNGTFGRGGGGFSSSQDLSSKGSRALSIEVSTE